MANNLKDRTFDLCQGSELCTRFAKEVASRGAAVKQVEPDNCETCEGETDPAWYGVGTEEQIWEAREYLRE